MTTNEAKKMLEEELSKAQKQYFDAEILYEQKIIGREIDDNLFNDKLWAMTMKYDRFEVLDYSSIHDVVSELKIWMAETETKHSKKPFFEYTKITADRMVSVEIYDENDWLVSSVRFECLWMEPYALHSNYRTSHEERIERQGKEQFKIKLAEMIYPEYKRHNNTFLLDQIDCKLFELFMDEKIDWNTFIELTKSNCKL